MPVNEKSPFTTLGISLDEARRLANLGPSLRKGSLSALERYYATLYHSDITKDPADDRRMAEINGALGVLRDDSSFQQALREYPMRSTRQQTDGGPPMLRQIEYVRNQARAEVREAKEEAENARTYAQTKDAEIEQLNREIGGLRQDLFKSHSSERRLKSTRVRSELLKEERERLADYSESLVARINYLNSLLLSGVNIDIPKGMISLSQVGGKRYVAGAQKIRKDVLRIGHDLTVEQESQPLKFITLANTLLLGGLREPYTFGMIPPLTIRYGPVLSELQPYLGIGMFPVVEVKNDRGRLKPLYVYGKIIDIKQLES